MTDKSDELWTKALWPDCLNEPAGSLMGMISDADMLHMMDDAGKHPEQDLSDVHKDSAHVPDAGDDALDLEPPSKLQATCKLDSQAAKTKAHREKQRRAQLNNKCASFPVVRCALEDVAAHHTMFSFVLLDFLREDTKPRPAGTQS